MSFNRRDFVKLGLGTLALHTVNLQPLLAAAKRKDIPLCLQMYSVGGPFRENPEKVLAAVAEMGYKGVEYAGYPLPPAELRKLQDKYGLICSGTHTGRGQIEDLEALKKTIEIHQTLGAKFIICPGMTNAGKEGWTEAAKKFSAASAIAREAGLYVGYHAHRHDFEKVDGGLSTWEVFADNSVPEVMLQNDLGHCVNSGNDPYALIRKYPGRTKTIHLKESDGKILGEGRVDWNLTFDLCESIGGIETYTIEYEAGMDRMEAAKKSAEAYYKIHG
ncbi:MAG: sugar phosphate isomerase/epimerase [Planctomycetia bacterium]|nr:sugar phosphate isomerase/epimerase [Planctomycetia bacterium]